MAGVVHCAGRRCGHGDSDLGTAIGDWRSQASPGDAAKPCRAEYRMDGRAWGPPGQEFERLDELLLVRGMTPATLSGAACRI